MPLLRARGTRVLFDTLARPRRCAHVSGAFTRQTMASAGIGSLAFGRFSSTVSCET
jgi:hypothetical protein